MKSFPKFNWQIFLLLFSGLMVRVIFSSRGTLWQDLDTWIAWANRLNTIGFATFYQAWCDYLPGFLYVLFVLGKIKLFLASINLAIPDYLLFKLPSILADLATAWLLYKLIRDWRRQKTALIIVAAYIFNPAVLANSTFWGQAESFFSFFLILAGWLIGQRKWLASSLALAFACLVKPNGILLLPLILFFISIYSRLGTMLGYVTTFLIFFLAAFIPFAPKTNLLFFVWQRLQASFNQYPYTSLNAFNLWSALNLGWQNDRIFKWIGWLIFAVFYVAFLYYFQKKKISFKGGLQKLFQVSTLVFFSAFLFLTRVHERHFFPVLPFLAITAFSFDLWLTYILVSLLYVLNLRYAFVWLTQNFTMIFSPILVQIFSFVFLTAFFYLSLRILTRINPFKNYFRLRGEKNKVCLSLRSWIGKFFDPGSERLGKPENIKRKNLILGFILLFAFLTRIINLWYPQSYIFDEVYHAFTAQEMVKGNKAAWEWWNTPPQGFAYEWTHPPLAKLIMAGGLIVGRSLGIKNDFFSWRFPAAIFGTLVIFLIYLLAKKLFKSEKIALASAFLLSCEGLTLVMSRVGMADIYFLFFMLLAIWLALEKKWWFVGLSWGLAIATKWTGMYILPLILFIYVFSCHSEAEPKNLGPAKLDRTTLRPAKRAFARSFSFDKLRIRMTIVVNSLLILILPIFIYLFVYLPFFTSGHTPKQFIELQKQMWWYHTRLKATHNYQSRAYTWPFDLRPVWFYVNYQPQSAGNIYALGNPLILWAGLVVLPLFAWDIISRKSKTLLLVLLAYFLFWTPWVFSPRIMFLYHYLPSVPFLVMILSWELNSLAKLGGKKSFFDFSARGGPALGWYFLLFTLSFVFFYALWTGIPIPNQFLPYFFWLPTWK